MGVLIAIIVAAIVMVALGFWLIQRQRRRSELKGRFGLEYDRTIKTAETRGEGEKQLVEREKRVEHFQLKTLERQESQRFSDEWRSAQGHFVDDPSGAIKEADGLVQQVMSARGYPITNFEQQAADISVDHPEVVSNYRAAHTIAEKNQNDGSSTEDLRQAMVYYRSLFDELLGAPATAQQSNGGHR
jgi:hypothetical protein